MVKKTISENTSTPKKSDTHNTENKNTHSTRITVPYTLVKYFNISNTHYKNNDFDSALKSFNATIKLACAFLKYCTPSAEISTSDINTFISYNYYMIGTIHLKTNNINSALLNFIHSLKFNLENINSYRGLSEVYRLRNENELANIQLKTINLLTAEVNNANQPRQVAQTVTNPQTSPASAKPSSQLITRRQLYKENAAAKPNAAVQRKMHPQRAKACKPVNNKKGVRLK